MAHRHRRDLLHYLVEIPEHTATLDECVGYLIDQEEARHGERPTSLRIRAVLQHAHLPKLENAGICEYNTRAQAIRYCGPDQFEAWLASLKEAI